MRILSILASLLVAIAPSWAEARSVLSNSGGSGVPTFMVGVGGAYADINTAVAAICAGAQGAVKGGCPGGTQTENIVFQVTSGGITTGTLQTITGWSAGTFTNTLEPDPSGGFRAYLNSHPDNPLYFNTAYGGFILQTAGNDGLDVNVNNFTMFGIQISSNNSSADGLLLGTNVLVATLDSNIIVSAGAIHNYPEVLFTATGGASLVKNNIIFGLNTVDSLDLAANTNINAYYNTFVMPVSISNQGAGILIASSGTVTVENNLALGFGSCGSATIGGNNSGGGYIFNGGGMANITASNNVTCMPDFVNNGSRPPAFAGNGYLFQRDGQVGAVLATEIVGPHDGRLAPTSVKAHGTARPLAGGITTDILGHPRNPRHDDAGAYSIGGVTPPALTGGTQYVITSGTRWTVGQACVGPHNWIEAIGGGGAGARGAANSDYTPSGGGGGGQYAAIFSYPFTSGSPGTLIPISVAAAAKSRTAGSPTTFGSVLKAMGGAAGQNAVATAAGGTGGIGMVLHDGGNGGSSIGIYAGSGGGGAGGRNGHGSNGGLTTGDRFIFGGGGGGGGNGGTVGQNDGGTEYGGGNGGAGTGGTSGANGLSPGRVVVGVGGANGGGGGGGGNVSGGVAGMNGGAGGHGTEYAGSGPGGGGGGGWSFRCLRRCGRGLRWRRRRKQRLPDIAHHSWCRGRPGGDSGHVCALVPAPWPFGRTGLENPIWVGHCLSG